MSLITQQDSGTQKSQAELLYQAQLRTQRQFKTNVAITWLILLGLLVLLFSGPIKVNSQFIRDNMLFIAGGLGQSKFPPVYALSTFYVSLIRGTPLYLQIMFFFLAMPQISTWWAQLPGLWAGVLALGLNYGAYMSETFRAGIASVGKGQREAAIALGMTPGQTMRRVVLPQALRFAIPPMGNDFISMTKDSALVAATGFVHEVMWRAVKVGRAQFHSLEALIMAAIFYWIMTLVLTSIQSRIETRLSKGDR